MHDAGDDTAKVLAKHEHVAAQKKRGIASTIINHLGPQAQTVNQS